MKAFALAYQSWQRRKLLAHSQSIAHEFRPNRRTHMHQFSNYTSKSMIIGATLAQKPGYNSSMGTVADSAKQVWNPDGKKQRSIATAHLKTLHILL